MRILSLTAENFKRLHLVELTLEAGVYVVGGRNAQGKSSVLDAFWAALGGEKAAPEVPVHAGEERAKIVLDLGDLKVTRTWTAAGGTAIRVESPDGARYPSPQSVLDKLVGKLSFDPLGFVRMPAKDQAKILRDLTGLNTADLDTERATVYAERTPLSAEAKRLEAQAAGIVVPPVPADPGEDVSISALSAELTEAAKTTRANDAARTKAAEIERDAERKRAEYTAKRQGYPGLVSAVEAAKIAAAEAVRKAEIAGAEAVAAAERRVREAEAEGLRLREVAETAEAAGKAAAEAAAALVDPDTETITESIRTAEADNRVKAATRRAIEDARRLAQSKAARLAEATEAAKKAAAKTARIDAIDAEKAARLKAATMPVDGLSVDGDVVSFGGLPLSQASSAEQLRVGLAIGAALNPRLRVIIVRDGSLLDSDSMAAVAAWAAEKDMQVLMERVGDTGGSVGVIIEDGRVSGA